MLGAYGQDGFTLENQIQKYDIYVCFTVSLLANTGSSSNVHID